uniref:Uncharacterized protein n=1 Tax=Strigamia maritima TaxID=126957 RepID=T1JJ91_STRMM
MIIVLCGHIVFVQNKTKKNQNSFVNFILICEKIFSDPKAIFNYYIVFESRTIYYSPSNLLTRVGQRFACHCIFICIYIFLVEMGFEFKKVEHLKLKILKK